MMDHLSRQEHLSRIETLWTVVREAHGGPGVQAAQGALIERYGVAAHRYLRALTRDSEAADELFQDFAVRILRGDLRRADPERGRFRDYVKRTLINLARDYRRSLGRRREKEVAFQAPEPASPIDKPEEELEREFVATWRQHLLDRTWDALAAEEPSGALLFAVLQLRTEHPQADSGELATALNERAKPAKPISAPYARKLLQRARERFADLLLDEVAASLRTPAGEGAAVRIERSDLEELETELIALDMQSYCRSALARRRLETRPAS